MVSGSPAHFPYLPRCSEAEFDEDAEERIDAEPPHKKGRLCHASAPAKHHNHSPHRDYGNPVAHWVEHETWPPRFTVSDQEMDVTASRKRPWSWMQTQSTSYTQLTKEGSVPRAYSGEHEGNMQRAGLMLTEDPDQVVITKECQSLCDTLMRGEYALPQSSSFKDATFRKILRQVGSRKKARVLRDITPKVVPSAELLNIDNVPGLEHITESVNVEWDTSSTICGPKPKPDFAAGIASSAFTADQKDKLSLYHTASCPNLFPESMYFPFLVCEVKSNNRPIREAERQAMHSASIATNAIIQLHKKTSLVRNLDREILAISVCHNNEVVKIFGHFALLGGEKINFCRHVIYQAFFTAGDLWRAYKIVRGVYEHFFPKHLERIKTAIANLRDPAPESVTSQLGSGVEDSVSRELAASASSSEGDGVLKKPTLPPISNVQQQNDRLLALLSQQQDQTEQQKKETRQREEQHKEEMRGQREMMERQMAQQKDILERQLAQQKDEHRELIALFRKSHQ